jgi:hypothetical protein
LIVANNIDASADRSVTDNLPAFSIEHSQFAFVATGKDEATFFIERYPTRACTPVAPSADYTVIPKIDSDGSTVP